MTDPKQRSKKQSDLKAELLPNNFVFYLDRSIETKSLVAALRGHGYNFEPHANHFPQDALDTEWLAKAGQEGWIVLTKDERIRYNPLELAALLEFNVQAFIVTAGNFTTDQLTQLVLDAIPQIVKFVAKNKPPFVVKVHKNGAIKQVNLSKG